MHPQSVIHSLVEYGWFQLAQLGNPDMRTPIAYGPLIPSASIPAWQLDLFKVATMKFLRRLRSISCLPSPAYQAPFGRTAAVLNAANEVAAAAFLDKQIPFLSIPRVIEAVLDARPSMRSALWAMC